MPTRHYDHSPSPDGPRLVKRTTLIKRQQDKRILKPIPVTRKKALRILASAKAGELELNHPETMRALEALDKEAALKIVAEIEIPNEAERRKWAMGILERAKQDVSLWLHPEVAKATAVLGKGPAVSIVFGKQKRYKTPRAVARRRREKQQTQQNRDAMEFRLPGSFELGKRR